MKTSVSLAGGLGNQLFQLFAAASATKTEEIFVERNFGRPNLDGAGRPKALMWSFPFNVRMMDNHEQSFLIQKEFNYLLGTSQKIGHDKVREWFARKSRVMASLGLPNSALISSTRDFINLLQENRDASCHFLGYFQTRHGIYEYARKNRSEISLVNIDNAYLNDFVQRLDTQRAVFVHARLGDYSTERKIGIAATEYYERCIKRISDQHDAREIYLFSDDPNRFMSQAPTTLKKRIVFVCDPEIPDYLQFEMFRKGSTFVLANSTYSWMGAALSDDENPVVYVPRPWFVGQNDPIDLIPSTWNEVSR